MPPQTALTAALASLAGGRRDAPTPGAAAVPRGGRPSLLFDPRAAADIGLDTLHEVGVSGFRDLCALDPRFEPFARTLFAPPATAPGRDALDAPATARLDGALATFARLVGPHAATPAAARALEYLLRRFRIGEAVPAVLVGAALPYHGTHAFVRLVRVCCLGGTPWAWLGESAGAGVPLPRAALVARCASDPAALAAVASLAEGEPGLPAAPGHLAFAAVTVCEALGAAAAPSKSGTGGGLTDATLRAVLPSVLGGLAPGAGPDRRAAALMVAAALAARASLSVDLVQALMVEAAKGLPSDAAPATTSPTVQFLAHLAATQPHAAAGAARSALAHVAAVPGLAAGLASLWQKSKAAPGTTAAGCLTGLLLPLLATASNTNSHHRALLLALCRGAGGALSAKDAGVAAKAVLAAGAAATAGEPSASAADLAATLRALDVHHPVAVAAAVDAALEPLRRDGGGGGGGGRAAAGAARVFTAAALGGTGAAPVSGVHESVSAALDSPLASARRAAVAALGVAGGDAADGSDGEGGGGGQAPIPPLPAALTTAVLARLADDDAGVVAAAASWRVVRRLPAPDAVPALVAAAARAQAAPKAGPAARRTLRSLCRLAREAAPPVPAWTAAAAAAVAAAAWPLPNHRKVARAAAEAGGKLGDAFLAGLGGAAWVSAVPRTPATPQPRAAKKAGAKAAAVPPPPAVTTPEEVEGAALDACRATVAAAGAGLLKGGSAAAAAAAAMGSAAAAPPPARALVYAAFIAGLAAASQADAAPVAQAALGMLASPAGAVDVAARGVRQGTPGDAEAAAAFPPAPSSASLPSDAWLAALGAPDRAAWVLAVAARRLAAMALAAAGGRAGLEEGARAAGGPAGLFARLATGGGPAQAAARAALLASVGPSGAAGLLADIIAAPAAACEAGGVDAGQGGQVAAAAAADLKKVSPPPPASSSLFPRLLAGIRDASTSKDARLAALAALQALKAPGEGEKAAAAALGAVAVRVGVDPAAVDRALAEAGSPALSAWAVGALTHVDTASPAGVAAAAALLAPASGAAPATVAEAAASALRRLVLDGSGRGVAPRVACAGTGSPMVSLALALVDAAAPGAPAGGEPAAVLLALAAGAVAAAASSGDAAAAAAASVPSAPPATTPAAASIVAAALKALGPAAGAAGPVRRAALAALLRAAARGVPGPATDAARAALDAAPLHEADISAALAAAAAALDAAGGGSAASLAKCRGGGRKSAPAAAAGAEWPALLEVLHWRAGAAGGGGAAATAAAAASLPALLALARALTRWHGRAWASLGAAAASEDDDEGEQQRGGREAGAALTAATGVAPPDIPYLLRLALGTAARAAASGTGPSSGRRSIDVAAVAEAAAACGGDAPTRAAALDAFSALAVSAPGGAAADAAAMPALAAIAAATACPDERSRTAAEVAARALAGAWVEAGRDARELAGAVVGVLLGLPATRRAGLLGTFAVNSTHASSSLSTASGAAPLALALLRTDVEGDEEEGGGSWAADLATQLMVEVPLPARAATLAAVIAAAADAAHHPHHSPGAPLPVAAVSLASRALRGAPAGGGAGDALLAAALAAAAVPHSDPGGPAASAAGLGLATALEACAPAGAYLTALAALASTSAGAPARRALRLAAAKAAALAGSEAAPAAVGGGAALCAALPPLLASPSTPESVKQAALAAFGAAATTFARLDPGPVLAALPSALAAAAPPAGGDRTATAALRGCGLAAAAAALGALGPAALPALPAALPSLLDAAEGAADRWEASAGERGSGREAGAASEGAELDAAAAGAAAGALVDGLGGLAAPALPRLLSLLTRPAFVDGPDCRHHRPAVAAGRRALAAMPARVPARLLLPALATAAPVAVQAGPGSAVALLGVAAATFARLKPAAAEAAAEGAAAVVLEAGMGARETMAGATPAAAAAVDDAAATALVALAERLAEAPFARLLARLVGWAAQAGPASGRVAALFAGVSAAAERLRSVFAPFARQVLDLGLACLESEAGGEEGVAATAVPAPAGPAAKRRRRADGVAAAAPPPPLATPPAITTAWLARLRTVRAFHRALLFDAGGAFADPGTVARLLPLLVAQLGGGGGGGSAEGGPAAVPEDTGAVLEADAAGGGEPMGCPDPAPSTGPARALPLAALARAAAGALAALATAAGAAGAVGASSTSAGTSADALKPINHAVLMATRAEAPHARAAALAALAGLAGAAGADYLPLLPEALPFIGELLEDGEAAVAARARDLATALEAAAGESLEPYLRA